MAVNIPQLDAVADLLKALRKKKAHHAAVAGLWGSGKTLAAVQTAVAMDRPLLIVARGPIEADGIYDDLTSLADPDRCLLLPAWEVLPTDVMDPADDIVAERMSTLRALTAAMEKDEPTFVVTPVRALLQYVVPREAVGAGVLTMAVGQELPMEDLLEHLVGLGYERDLMVEQRGQMSVRGGIFDIFPISAELPYRVEFFGDEIESIRPFEPETQRSVGTIDEIQILPRSEKGILRRAKEEDALAVLTDYFPKNTLVVLDEPAAIHQEAELLHEQLHESPFSMAWDAGQEHLESFTRVALSQMPTDTDADTARLSASMQTIGGWRRDPEGFWKQLEQWGLEGYAVYILCNNPGERRRMLELLGERGYKPGQESFPLDVSVGRLQAGFASQADRMAVLSEREIFGRHFVRRRRRRFEAGESLKTMGDLKVGDYIVHEHHGIGCYLGLRRFEGKSGDFLTIKYSKGDKLYLPASNIDAIQRYSAGEGKLPKIDKLGGSTWAKTKDRVKKAVRDMTEELVKLYAARETNEGHAFNGDTPWQNEFEDEFPYDETPDQARAIAEVKRDMESVRPMERLICGDVGFGKTEVALRAAFKCVMDGKQVAILVPTTVLAEQHFNTFSERLADYPMEVGLLSRFRTAAQQKKTVERLKSGEVDIIIGTHRLVSKDIEIKNLGLLIIDEEQRFGVAQKEKLKQLRVHVDVLTLSATPIPRTLNLSLLGTRDMSLINTAPNDRLPVHTCIENFDDRLIAEAIHREIAREGQVFFLHNRVQNIEKIAEMIQRLVPHARIAIGHGQMPEKALERVMTDFVLGKIDVLVCTTIIGSGIDIPNANTIIVNNADNFGLAELYQLRGRVGRYKHRAFAYLLVPGDRALSEDAEKRLKALEEFSTLGSGFRIAMRDLEIRGAGNLLGGEQSGNIAAVGFDTYAQLIEEAVAEIKGQPKARHALPPFDMAVDAFIPEGYVPSSAQKITLYKRIASIRDLDEATEMAEELKDRFGTPPAPVRRLLEVVRVRALGAEAAAKRIASVDGGIAIEFDSGRPLHEGSRNNLLQQFGDRLSFAWNKTPTITLQTPKAESPEDLIDAAEELLNAIAEE
jgi:transcription-repair coupling factor (superfamily II helicase)